ncbi:MAG: insulinase family protein [Tessaracoccus sp.]|uniref:M16 family metallopeptidase n=1 Tax=Tessaracoccus sp. TaxID=1971211 RepID=UPI001EBCC63E|nr:pitrilysin family protein [Tessaracoccus sp.]MBK7821347.1 insulinase family protein [Tessaracoccus sp.]
MTRPAVTAASPWTFPTPQIRALDNGATAWIFHLPGQHIATFEVLLPTPLEIEPRAVEGIATVALHAVDEGTRSHPDGAIGELLEAQGATLHGSARYPYTTFGGQAPVGRLGRVLPLFVETLSEPAYAPRDVAHHVEAQLAGHASRLASPGAANKLAFRQALYGADHRDGRPGAGVPVTLNAITPDDARAWHDATWLPDGATFLLAGDLPADLDLDALLAWQGAPRELTPSDTPATQPPCVVVVDHPGAVQATVTIGTRAPSRRHPDWPALRVAGHAIVGAFASRLNLELRERLGYTYGIGGGFAPGVDEGLFSIAGSVRTEVAGDAIARLLDGLSLAEPFTEEEADDARRYLVSVAPLANETSADIVGQATALAAAGLDPSYLRHHFAQLAETTPAEATSAFRRHVTADALTIAVTGRAEDLVPALTGIGLAPEVVDLGS